MDELDNLEKEFNANESSLLYDHKPQNMDYDMFNLRNNPEKHLETIYLYLSAQKKNFDPKTRATKPYIREPNTSPLANAQGIREIMGYLTGYFNGHIVQTSVEKESLNQLSRFISDEMTIFIWSHRKKWGIDVTRVNPAIQFMANTIHLFLRRGLDDKERTHYGESFKEETHRTTNNTPKKGRLVESMAKAFGMRR